jgi:hypothetical protein
VVLQNKNFSSNKPSDCFKQSDGFSMRGVASNTRFHYFQCETWVDHPLAVFDAACRSIAGVFLELPETAVHNDNGQPGQKKFRRESTL